MRSVLDKLTHNWQLKLTAVAIAFLLWLGVQDDKPHRLRMSNVPVRVVNKDGEWVQAAPPSPATVSVEFSGRFRDLLRLPDAKPAVFIPVDDVRDTAAVYTVRRTWVDVGTASHDIVIGNIRPDTIRVSFDRMATRLVALGAQFTGVLPDGYELENLPVIDPPVVRASGPSRRLARMDTIRLPSINVSGLTAGDTIELTIDTAGYGVSLTPRRVKVVVPIRKKQSLLVPDSVR